MASNHLLTFTDLKGDYRERYKALLAQFTKDANDLIEEFRTSEVEKLHAKAEALSVKPTQSIKALTGAEALLNLQKEGEITVTEE